MEQEDYTKELKEVTARREALAEERDRISQLEEETSYHTKKDKALFEQIAHEFKEDQGLKEVCSSYQTMIAGEERSRRSELDEYYASVAKEQEELRDQESLLQHKLQEKEA